MEIFFFKHVLLLYALMIKEYEIHSIYFELFLKEKIDVQKNILFKIPFFCTAKFLTCKTMKFFCTAKLVFFVQQKKVFAQQNIFFCCAITFIVLISYAQN